MLIKKKASLKPENFQDFDDYLLKRIRLDKRMQITNITKKKAL